MYLEGYSFEKVRVFQLRLIRSINLCANTFSHPSRLAIWTMHSRPPQFIPLLCNAKIFCVVESAIAQS